MQMEAFMRFTCSNLRALTLALTLGGSLVACVGDLADESAESQAAALASGPVSVVRKGSNKCLDVPQSSTSNGAKTQQWTCNGSGAQIFKFEDRGGGVYGVVNTNSGKCLDVSGGNTSNGTAIQQWACSDSNKNQRFEVQDRGDGYVRLRNPNSGKCVDVNAASSSDGAKVQIWSCNSSDAQLWKLQAEDGGDDGSSDDDSADDGSTDDSGDGDGTNDPLVWRKANLTNFTSYPDPNSEECREYNGCTWAGQFAFVDGTQPKSWVQSHNIAAVHSRDAGAYKLKTLRLKQGSHQIDVKVYDMCADSDCSGCCTRNANAGGIGFLIDIESYTMDRFGSGDGVVEWACLDCQ
jgi:hypothetical protein